MGYLKGYLEGLAKADEICKDYLGDLTTQAGPAKITIACANNILDFVRDDIEAHAQVFRQENRIPDSSGVLSVGMEETDYESPLPAYLGRSERRSSQPLGVIKSFSGRIKKRGS